MLIRVGGGLSRGGSGAVRGVRARPGVGAAVWTGPSPSVSGVTRYVQPGVGQAQWSGLAPAVALPVVAAPGVGAATWTGYAPAITGLMSAEAASWISAVVAAGGTVSAGRGALIDTLITGLKSDGIWTKLDRLWILAAENSQSALVDLKGLTSATAVNSPTFAADAGYTSNGSTSYLNSNYNPATDGVAYTQNSSHLAMYSAVSLPASLCAAIAIFDGSKFAQLGIDSNYPVYLANDASSLVPAGSQPAGMYIGTRTASNARAIYKNGSATALTSDTTASTGVPSIPSGTKSIFMLARNFSGSADAFTSIQFSAFSIGGGLTGSEAAALMTRVNAYMTSLGINKF